MGDEGEEGVQNLKKWVASLMMMDGPKSIISKKLFVKSKKKFPKEIFYHSTFFWIEI